MKTKYRNTKDVNKNSSFVMFSSFHFVFLFLKKFSLELDDLYSFLTLSLSHNSSTDPKCN